MHSPFLIASLQWFMKYQDFEDVFILECNLLEDYWKQRRIEDIMGIYACTESIVLLARLL